MPLPRPVLLSVLLALIAACSGDDSDTATTALYSASCEQACANQAECSNDLDADLSDCVVDCETEPWAGNYRECQATTCGLSELECERFGIKTCDEACAKQVECAEVPSGESDACVADCRNEPWPGNYVDCQATLCGASDAQCEGFTGQ